MSDPVAPNSLDRQAAENRGQDVQPIQLASATFVKGVVVLANLKLGPTKSEPLRIFQDAGKLLQYYIGCCQWVQASCQNPITYQ
jgi:hypothetical protein